MQVYDGKKLAREGIKNLIDAILKLIEDSQWRYSYDFRINPTGGYKGIVPYLTLIGMFYNIPTVYVFQEADELIKLPRIPIKFNLDDLKQIVPALERLESDGALSEGDFWEGLSVKYEDRSNYDAFFDRDEKGDLTLSGIGLLLWNKYREENPPPIPESTVGPEAKDCIREAKQEPSRTAKFESFRLKLCNHHHVDRFYYLQGCGSSERKVNIKGEKELLVYFEGIVLRVKTTAIHPKHIEVIRDEIERLLE